PMLVQRWLVRSAVFVALVAAVGCSGGGGQFATVSGVVTQNNAPVDGAKVTFYSTVQAEGQQGGVCSVLTDSSGKYLISAVGNNPGLPPGMYKVTIVKLDQKGNLPPDFDAGQMEASGMATNKLPKDYENLNTTKLSVTLEAGKNEHKDFDLKGTASNAKVQGGP